MLDRRALRLLVAGLLVAVFASAACDATTPSDLYRRREFVRRLPGELCSPTGYYGQCLRFDYESCLAMVGPTVRDCGRPKRPVRYENLTWEASVLGCVRGLMILSNVLDLRDNERCNSWPSEQYHRPYRFRGSEGRNRRE